MSIKLLVDTWMTVKELFLETNIRLLSWTKKYRFIEKLLQVLGTLIKERCICSDSTCKCLQEKKIKNPSKIIHLQGLFVKHFYFPSVLFSAITTWWVWKEVKVTFVMEKYCRKNCYRFFFFFFVRSPLQIFPLWVHKEVHRCLSMFHSIYEYINNVFKIRVDDLRRAKTKHKAGKKLHLMLLWCSTGLLVVWGILHIIKFEDVLSIQSTDNIKAWWKDLCFKQFN